MDVTDATRSTPRLDTRPLVIAGATGFLGRHLVASARGMRRPPILAIARPESRDLPEGIVPVRGDMADAAFLQQAIPTGSAVVNLVYAADSTPERNLAFAEALAEACARAGVERLVHVSTAVVVGLCADREVTELTVPRPVTDYQRTKLEIERTLSKRARGRFPLVILRPTGVFGAGGANLVKLTRNLRHGSRLVNYVRSSLSGRRAMNLVPVETVVAAIEFVLESPRALQDELYIVSEDACAENNFGDVERILQQALGVKSYPVAPLPVPEVCLTVAQRLTGRLSIHPATRFSGARLARAGFVPPTTFQQALENYATQAGAASTQP